MRKGACAASVAFAAGSRARTRAGLRSVGLRLISRLRDRDQIYETFARLGFALEDFCRGVIAGTRATKTMRYYYRGRLVAEYKQPDNEARTAALWQYMVAVGIPDLPLEAPPEDPDLRQLVEAWPELRADVRAELLRVATLR